MLVEGIQSLLFGCTHYYDIFYLEFIMMCLAVEHTLRNKESGVLFSRKRAQTQTQARKIAKVTITHECYWYIFTILVTVGGDANQAELGTI